MNNSKFRVTNNFFVKITGLSGSCIAIKGYDELNITITFINNNFISNLALNSFPAIFIFKFVKK